MSLIKSISKNHLGNKIMLATVSGIATTNMRLIRWFDENIDVDIITSKSIQIENNPGNREPIIVEDSDGNFGNSVGLRNPGIIKTKKMLSKLYNKKKLNKFINISISGANAQDFLRLSKELSEYADLIELNVSCPHATNYGSDIGIDVQNLYAVTQSSKSVAKCPVFVKLTPNVKDITIFAKTAIDAGADGIVAINTSGPINYIEPHSQTNILNNQLGGLGGQSGQWILEKAISSIEKIRKCLGEEVPIIGMGGIDNPYDAYKIHKAGADVVGIGSALARIHQKYWAQYFNYLKKETNLLLTNNYKTNKIDHINTNNKQKVNINKFPFIKANANMQYRKLTVSNNRALGNDLFSIEFKESLNYLAGESYFLWLPNIGEKPFAPATSNTLSFIIKARGYFSENICKVTANDHVYIRGPYGETPFIPNNNKVLLLAAGSGCAVLPKLAEQLVNKQNTITSIISMRNTESKNILKNILAFYGKYEIAYDNGIQGRILQNLDQVLYHGYKYIYVIGPEQFMTKAMSIANKYMPANNIFCSLERTMMCGVGMCGLCHCDGLLTCNYGTFVDYNQLFNEQYY